MPWNTIQLWNRAERSTDERDFIHGVTRPGARRSTPRRLHLSSGTTSSRRADQHVEPLGDGWCVRPEGDAKPSFVGPSRHEAFVWAADIARRDRVRLHVHRTNGTVATTLDFGAD